MIYNLEKIEVVVNKIIRDLGLGKDEIPWQDLIEWIAEGLQQIGAYSQLQQKEDIVIINDYVGFLPCDVYKVIRLLNGTRFIEPTSGFYGGTFVGAMSKLGISFNDLSGKVQIELMQGKGLSSESKFKQFSSQLSYNGNLIGNPTTNSFTSLDYNLNFNKITTAYQYGVIEVQYLALPLDDRGFPLVPDSQEYRDALFWKCAYQLCLRNPDIFKNKALQNFDYVRQRWLGYCKQARASAYMPDMDGIQRLANNWTRLVNQIDYNKVLYNGIGKQQNLSLDGRY